MAALGIEQEAIEAEVEQEAAQGTCEIHADNETTALAFLSLRTQWRLVSGMSGVGMSGVAFQGLEYAAIPPVLELLQVPRKQRAIVFAELQVMERAALAVLNVKREADGAEP
jgi:hypothetical protein